MVHETDLPCSDCGAALVERTVTVRDQADPGSETLSTTVAESPECDALYYPEQTLSQLSGSAFRRSNDDGAPEDSLRDIDTEAAREIDLPDVLLDGTTILVAAAFDPSDHAICLRLLAKHATPNDHGIVVTTRTSAAETVETWNHLTDAENRPTIGIVDTTSAGQSVTATYGDIPTVFTPTAGDLERIVMALAELSQTTAPRRSRHLVFRSMTPILNDAPPEHVCRVVERVSGLRTGTGLGLFGIDATAHDRETLTRVSDTLDAAVWLDQSRDGEFEVSFHPRRVHVPF